MSGEILLVDDEISVVRALRPALLAAGYGVTVAMDGNAAIAVTSVSAPDLALLDLGLPDLDGKEVIREIRARSQMPIIVVSARHQQDEKIAALDAGADDYIDKPFDLGELLARVRVGLRRVAGAAARQAGFDGGILKIDFATRSVTLLDEPLRLSPKEFALLRVLAESAGQVVTHRRLLAAGWGRSDADPQYLRIYMGLLRQKIEENPATPELIRTEAGVGYRLCLPGQFEVTDG